jgi:hypothetical protein
MFAERSSAWSQTYGSSSPGSLIKKNKKISAAAYFSKSKVVNSDLGAIPRERIMISSI